MLEDLGIKTLHEQEYNLFPKICRPDPAPNQSPTQLKKGFLFSGSKMTTAESDHSYMPTAKFKIQWSYTSTQPVRLQGTYCDFILPLPPTYVHISQEFTSFMVL